jgi:hypothetical protein
MRFAKHRSPLASLATTQFVKKFSDLTKHSKPISQFRKVCLRLLIIESTKLLVVKRIVVF